MIRRRNGLLAFVLLCLVALFAYYNTLRNPFFYDDIHHIVTNPHIRDLSNIPHLFTDSKTFTGVKASRGEGFHYRPLVLLTYTINYAAGGLNPVGYHVVNLAFHVGSTFLIFLIVQTMLGNSNTTYFAALAAGLIFLVHPFNSEVVNYISTRSSVMSGFFYLLAFWCWVRFRNVVAAGFSLRPRAAQISQAEACGYSLRDPGGVPRNPETSSGQALKVAAIFYYITPYYIASLLAFVAGMLSKEVLITLPIVLWLYDFYFTSYDERRLKPAAAPYSYFFSWRHNISYLPFVFIVVIPYLVIRASWLGESLSHSRRSIGAHLFTEIPVLLQHWRMFLIPYPLTPIHDAEVYNSFWSFPVIVSSIILITYVVIVIMLCRSACHPLRVISFFMFWFFIVLLPTTIIPLGLIFQEHRGYLAVVSFVALTGVSVEALRRSIGMKGVAALLILLTGIYSTVTIHRNSVWRDDLTIWTDTVRKSQKSPIAHTGLGIAYKERNLYDRAIETFQKALALDGQEALTARQNLAQIYMVQSRWELAAMELEKAEKMSPRNPQIQNDLGIVYDSLGKAGLAERHFLRAAEIEPNDYLSYFNLGVFYSKQGRFEEASGVYQKALFLSPGHIPSRLRLGRALEEMGQKKEAAEQYLLALKQVTKSDATLARKIKERLKGMGYPDAAPLP